MKIIHLSTSDFGGAFSAAYKIHKLTQNLGHDCKLYCKYSLNISSYDESKYISNPALTLLKGIKRKIRRFFNKYLEKKHSAKDNLLLRYYCFFQFKEGKEKGLNPRLVRRIKEVDVLFVHWVTNFVNFYDIKNIQKKTNCKVVFTMMDMAPITGGCHYTNNCHNYQIDCANCPALPDEKNILSQAQLLSKYILAQVIKPEIITFSPQNYEDALKSKVPFAKYHLLNLPYDPCVFKPLERVYEKRNGDYFNILGSAFTGSNIRKGPNYLFETLIILDELNYGEKKIRVFHVDLDFELKHEFNNVVFQKFDFIKDSEKLAEFYNIMDLIIFTSVADAAPQMMAEVLMCGIPVVSFNIGNSEHIIENEIDGFVVPLFDCQALASKSYLSLTSPPKSWATKDDRHKRASKKHVPEEFSAKIQSIIETR